MEWVRLVRSRSFGGFCEYSNALLCNTNFTKYLALLMHQAISKVTV